MTSASSIPRSRPRRRPRWIFSSHLMMIMMIHLYMIRTSAFSIQKGLVANTSSSSRFTSTSLDGIKRTRTRKSHDIYCSNNLSVFSNHGRIRSSGGGAGTRHPRVLLSRHHGHDYGDGYGPTFGNAHPHQHAHVLFLSSTTQNNDDVNKPNQIANADEDTHTPPPSPSSSSTTTISSSSAAAALILPTDALTKSERQERTRALHEQLTILGIDAENLGNAVHKSMTTLEGNDPYYGKSAIKAYRTFLYPRPSKVQSARGEDVLVAASRCARQIDFLAKRHRSREAEWVRHTDRRESSNHNNDGNGDGDGDDSVSSSLILERSEKKLFPLIVLLDNVRSAFNVGSIFRTADACGCSMVLTTGITPNPNGSGREKLSKSALNADRVVPTKHFTTTREAVEYVRDQHPGFALMGMETTERSKCYTTVTYPGKGLYTERGVIPDHGVVIVLGNEVHGVDTEIMPLLDELVELPMFGQKNSLNIAACAPVVLYEILRQWGAMDQDR